MGTRGRCPANRWPLRLDCTRILIVFAGLLLTLAQVVPAAAQTTGTVTGRVRGEASDVVLVGAQVFLVGTGLGTVTGDNGRFIILNVPAGTHRVRVERIGSRPAEQEIEVRAGETTQVDFEMRTEALGLDEIVVTGTAGAARRREIGNSIAQINAANLPEPPVNVDAMLQARAPGMSVLQGSAMAGSGAMIRLRGNVSVAMSNQPIIYVDGVRMRSDGFAKNVPPVGFAGRSGNDVSSPLNDINPSDIARIEVIKGAAATTLYGTEAAAGVIQIFTKQGHTGRAQWTAQIDQGFQHVLKFGVDSDRRPPSEAAVTSAGGTPEYMFIDPWLRNSVPLLGGGCSGGDNQGFPDYCEQIASRQRYALSVAGGGEALRYFVSGTYEDNVGLLPNDAEEKSVIRGNFTFSPLRNLEFQWNTSFTNNDISHTPAGNNAHGITLNAFRRDRNYNSSETRAANDPLLNYEIDTKIKHLITGGTVTYNPIPALSNRLTAGWDLSQVELRNLRPFGYVLAPLGIISNQRVEYQNLTLDYVGTLNVNLTEDLRTSFSWGGQSIATDEVEVVAYGENFPGPGEPTVSNADPRLGFENRERVINAGFFFQNLFDFKDRYFLTAGIRVDGNSAFGENLGLQAYPKASFSYVMSDEAFWPEDFGQMKLRAAWGQSGRAPGAFDAVRTWQAVGWGGQPAFFPSNVGNPDIGPERTTELELGFDASFLGDRLSTEFTWYQQRTKDALFNVRQVPSLGFLSSQLENVGELENKGIELAVRGTVFRGQNFGWELGASAYTNFSKVVSLGGAPGFLLALANHGWVVEGQPVPVVRSRCLENPDAREAPRLVRDADNNPVDCNHGPNLPTHTYGVNTTINLPHGILVSARGEYMGGHYMYDGPAFNAIQRSVIWPGCFDYYTLQEAGRGDEATALQRARCTVSGLLTDYFIYPADFFKLRELTLSLPVPERWVPGASSARLTLAGHSLWKWVNKDFLTFDPEMLAQDGFNTQYRQMSEHVPPPATYTMSLRVTF